MRALQILALTLLLSCCKEPAAAPLPGTPVPLRGLAFSDGAALRLYPVPPGMTFYALPARGKERSWEIRGPARRLVARIRRRLVRGKEPESVSARAQTVADWGGAPARVLFERFGARDGLYYEVWR